jgi:hypothetical protein
MPVLLATLEVEIRRIRVQDQTRHKVNKIPISTNKKQGIVWYTCYPSYLEA